MKKTVAKKLVKALRSGDYEQGRDSLKCDNRFCCLGVLCDLYAKEKNKRWRKCWRKEGYMFAFMNEYAVLPRKVQEWAGMSSNTGVIAGRMRSLASLNDAGKSFEEIARVIEKNVEKL